MRCLTVILALAMAALWSEPSFAQSRAQLGPLCTNENTPADAQIDACSKIIALKAFSGAQLATVYFWRAVSWNKKGDYAHVIADTTEAIRLKPEQALYNMRGSAYFDKASTTSRSPTTTWRSSTIPTKPIPTRSTARRKRPSAISMARLADGSTRAPYRHART